MEDAATLSKTVKEAKDKTQAILQSDANCNLIVDLIELSESEDEKLLLTFIRSAHKIFTSFSSRGKLQAPSVTAKESEDPEDIFSCWLRDKYLLAVKRLLHLLTVGTQNVKELALCTLMKFTAEEGKLINCFPNELFRQICDALFDGKHSMKNCNERFAEFLEYDDVRFYVLKNLGKFLGNISNSKESTGQFLVENTLTMLSKVKMKKDDKELNNFLTDVKKKKKYGKNVKSEERFHLLREHRRVFSSAWLGFLSIPLTSEVHKKVLLNLHTDVLPHMSNPKLLMDFLTDSYNTGGVTSLLALNSLFVLIHKHNLEYPDFFKKLYALFEPNIFHTKYQSRFFHLADLFLMSTHLPAYLVAAFVKRLSRLALTAPPSGAMLAIPFVCNLIRRHPSVQVLIHQKQSGRLLLEGDTEDVSDSQNGDPFVADEPDPAKCNALESSLWELKTLQSHYYPGVLSLVEMLEKPLGTMETDISEYFDNGYDQLFQKQCRKITEENAFLEFQVPKGIFSKALLENWALE